MAIYIPFIHKLPKKRREIPEQIPLYIEEYRRLPQTPEKTKDDDKEVIIIQLL